MDWIGYFTATNSISQENFLKSRLPLKDAHTEVGAVRSDGAAVIGKTGLGAGGKLNSEHQTAAGFLTDRQLIGGGFRKVALPAAEPRQTARALYRKHV